MVHIASALQKASKHRLHLGLIRAQVHVCPSPPALRRLLEEEATSIQANYPIQALAKIPQLAALRDTYKALGKKPQKYRGSSEALLRRIVRGLGLYYVNNVVDINNLLSLRSKRSLGCYDLSTIEGEICFDVGRENEPYVGIGRGSLNIAHLPVFRDNLGAFGSPTSDSQRSCIRDTTKQILMFFIAFDGSDQLSAQLHMASELLQTFASASQLHSKILEPDATSS